MSNYRTRLQRIEALSRERSHVDAPEVARQWRVLELIDQRCRELTEGQPDPDPLDISGRLLIESILKGIRDA